jgi:hypothetical protein
LEFEDLVIGLTLKVRKPLCALVGGKVCCFVIYVCGVAVFRSACKDYLTPVGLKMVISLAISLSVLGGLGWKCLSY